MLHVYEIVGYWTFPSSLPVQNPRMVVMSKPLKRGFLWALAFMQKTRDAAKATKDLKAAKAKEAKKKRKKAAKAVKGLTRLLRNIN